MSAEENFLNEVNNQFEQAPGTTLRKVEAKGTGVCRDKDGNLLDREGKIVASQQEKDEV